MDLPSIDIQVQTATARRLAVLLQRIESAIQESEVKQAVRLVASSRGLMVDPVIEACEAGVAEFCEDYLPEGVTKKPAIIHRFPNTTWHFTGTLPPAKLSLVVEFFEWIDSFDRKTLLKPLSEACKKHPNKKIKVLIEVNPIGLTKKVGASLEEVADLCNELTKIKQVELKGLSCRSELMMNRASALKAYELTANVHRKLLKNGDLPSSANELAMGSSRDLEAAISMGSTLIRVGSALFGKTAASKTLTPVDEF